VQTIMGERHSAKRCTRQVSRNQRTLRVQRPNGTELDPLRTTDAIPLPGPRRITSALCRAESIRPGER
jgi:hypothetical protein